MRLPLVVAVLTAALPSSALASRGADAGQPCGLTVTNSVDQHFNSKTAEVHGGPWLATDYAAPGLASNVSIRCELEFRNVNCFDTTEEFYAPSSAPSSGAAVLTPQFFTFWDMGPAIYVGTTLTWTYADGSSSVRHLDADPVAPGTQCARLYDGNEA